MTRDIHLIKKGNWANTSELALLQKLNVKPYTYGMNLIDMYNSGSFFDTHVFDTTNNVLAENFIAMLNSTLKLSLALYLSTKARITYSVANMFKACHAVTVELEKCTFKKGGMYMVCTQSPPLLFLPHTCCFLNQGGHRPAGWVGRSQSGEPTD